MALKRLQEVDVDGIGVVFNDDFTGVDLDNAIDDSGAIKPWAAEILKECPTYTEKSPSGTGLHLITAGSLQKGWKGTKRAYHDGAVEIYSRGRFFTMTGDSLNGHDGDLHDYSPRIRELYKRIGGPVPTNGNGRRIPQSEPVLDLSERLEVALREPVFYRLWHGDTSGNHDDDSAADLALCNKLVFYFGKNFWISIVARVYCPGCQVDNIGGLALFENRRSAPERSPRRVGYVRPDRPDCPEDIRRVDCVHGLQSKGGECVLFEGTQPIMRVLFAIKCLTDLAMIG